jgi:DNA-directed RNA polymerase specialized sigma24 family protein
MSRQDVVWCHIVAPAGKSPGQQRMQRESMNDRLSHISTLWSVVCRAHQEPAESMRSAQQQLIERYGGAIRRYLHGALRDPDAADEVFQDFAVRFVKGSLRGADPNRGRFRDFVKGVLSHLVADYYKRRRVRFQPLDSRCPEPAVDAATAAELDQEFVKSWRDELLLRSWVALNQVEQQTGQPFYTVLRFRAEHPDIASPQMAQQLSAQLGRTLTDVAIRQTLHRARQKYADLLIEEVAHLLESPAADQLEQELIELDLLDYCRPALQRRSRVER